MAVRCRGGAALDLQGQGGTAAGADQPQADRQHKRLFRILARRGWAALGKVQGVAVRFGVIVRRGGQPGRAGLAVPALELRQQAGQCGVRVRICNRLGKVVAGHGTAIMAGKVERHAFGKT